MEVLQESSGVIKEVQERKYGEFTFTVLGQIPLSQEIDIPQDPPVELDDGFWLNKPA